MKPQVITIGASSGGIRAIKQILENLSGTSGISILVVLHIGNKSNDPFIDILNKETGLKVKEAEEKEIIAPGMVYFAPPNYHLMVEEDGSLSLSTENKVNYSRPSIDVLFETAAWAFQNKLLGILLTGSSSDGAKGMETIKKFGGITIVEDPQTANSPIMPQAAINLITPDYISSLENIPLLVDELL